MGLYLYTSPHIVYINMCRLGTMSAYGSCLPMLEHQHCAFILPPAQEEGEWSKKNSLPTALEVNR